MSPQLIVLARLLSERAFEDIWTSGRARVLAQGLWQRRHGGRLQIRADVAQCLESALQGRVVDRAANGVERS